MFHAVSLRSLVLVVLVAGCGGGGGGYRPPIKTDAGVDLAGGMAAQDLTMGGNTCQDPEIDCEGTCVNPNTDKNNCGGCGEVCGANQTCVDGACKTQMMGNLTGCNSFIACYNDCADAMCVQACLKKTTPKGQQLVMAVFQCLETACPTMNGGVCDENAGNFSQAKCDMCFSAAQMMGGKCFNQIQACINDKP